MKKRRKGRTTDSVFLSNGNNNSNDINDSVGGNYGRRRSCKRHQLFWHQLLLLKDLPLYASSAADIDDDNENGGDCGSKEGACGSEIREYPLSLWQEQQSGRKQKRSIHNE